jgi:hypothetical protein
MLQTIRAVVVMAAFALLGACASAAISDIATDKVKVKATGNDQKLIMAEAEKGCAIYKRVPVALSKRCVDAYCTKSEFLFACQDPTGANTTPRT